MNFDEYLEESLKNEELRKEYDKITRKQITVICPKCGNCMTYKNWFSWIWHTPFHWFSKRKVKCTKCGVKMFMARRKF
jgi:ribosomal protein S27AE